MLPTYATSIFRRYVPDQCTDTVAGTGIIPHTITLATL